MRVTKNILLGLLTGVVVGFIVYVIIQLRNQERDAEFTWLTWMDEDWGGQGRLVKEDDLEVIHGIGPAYARRLKAAGIVTYLELASQTPVQLEKIMGPRVRAADLGSWIQQAKKLSS
jgi:Helix-hairpin-helix domain